MAIQISYGKEHDRKYFIEVIEDITIKTNRRPRTRPQEVLADAAYDDGDTRQHLRSGGIQSNIPINPRNTNTRKRGRPTRFNPETYAKRGAVE
ncbi:MAG: hypothetical protein JG777_1805 [Clostridia bacterium]|nr:hypothetical protein [Clostridia bacterium]